MEKKICTAILENYFSYICYIYVCSSWDDISILLQCSLYYLSIILCLGYITYIEKRFLYRWIWVWVWLKIVWLFFFVSFYYVMCEQMGVAYRNNVAKAGHFYADGWWYLFLLFSFQFYFYTHFADVVFIFIYFFPVDVGLWVYFWVCWWIANRMLKLISCCFFAYILSSWRVFFAV